MVLVNTENADDVAGGAQLEPPYMPNETLTRRVVGNIGDREVMAARGSNEFDKLADRVSIEPGFVFEQLIVVVQRCGAARECDRNGPGREETQNHETSTLNHRRGGRYVSSVLGSWRCDIGILDHWRDRRSASSVRGSWRRNIAGFG